MLTPYLQERTTLSEQLVSKQKELAALLATSATATATAADQKDAGGKRPLSRFMAASATGLEGVDVSAGAAPVPVPVPRIAEQFLQQRPLPKFIPPVLVSVFLSLLGAYYCCDCVFGVSYVVL